MHVSQQLVILLVRVQKQKMVWKGKREGKRKGKRKGKERNDEERTGKVRKSKDRYR